MPIICWGNQAKAADDPLRIEQAIENYMSAHNQNPNAHMGAGYSLGAHRQEEALDHIDGSVGLRKLPVDRIVAVCCFESFDNWSAIGLQTGGLNNSSIANEIIPPSFIGRMSTPFPAGPVKLDFSKNPFFQTTVKFVSATAQEAYIVAGDSPDQDNDDSFGFYIHDASLYAYWTKEGTEYTQEITGITITDMNVYRAYYDSVAEEIYFYVNGVLKYTATTNLPTDTNDRTFAYWIKSDDDEVKRQMYMIDFLFEIDR